MTIEVPPDLAQALEEKARQSGSKSVAEFAIALLAQATDMNQGNITKQLTEIAARMTALKRIGSYDTRLRAGLPPLSDADISRASIYEGRGL